MTGPFAWLLALLGFRASSTSGLAVSIAVPRWLERQFGEGITVELIAYPGARAFPQYIQIWRPWE